MNRAIVAEHTIVTYLYGYDVTEPVSNGLRNKITRGESVKNKWKSINVASHTQTWMKNTVFLTLIWCPISFQVAGGSNVKTKRRILETKLIFRKKKWNKPIRNNINEPNEFSKTKKKKNEKELNCHLRRIVF